VADNLGWKPIPSVAGASGCPHPTRLLTPICSRKRGKARQVDGARRSNGDKLGTIQRVMIDKRTGKVAYAVMTFGGFLGISDEYRALPWSVLRYNENLDAYELNVTEDQLRNAPVLATGWDTGVIGRDWERNIHDYYRASPYW
jgi:hypothetical protein